MGTIAWSKAVVANQRTARPVLKAVVAKAGGDDRANADALRARYGSVDSITVPVRAPLALAVPALVETRPSPQKVANVSNAATVAPALPVRGAPHSVRVVSHGREATEELATVFPRASKVLHWGEASAPRADASDARAVASDAAPDCACVPSAGSRFFRRKPRVGVAGVFLGLCTGIALTLAVVRPVQRPPSRIALVRVAAADTAHTRPVEHRERVAAAPPAPAPASDPELISLDEIDFPADAPRRATPALRPQWKPKPQAAKASDPFGARD